MGEAWPGHNGPAERSLLRDGCVPAGAVEALVAAEPHRVEGKALAGLRRHGMEEDHNCRGHATVTTAVIGVQLIGQAVWGRWQPEEWSMRD